MTLELQELFPISDAQSSALSDSAGSVHFSSATDDWPTPQYFYDKIEAEFGPMDLDPCSSHENHKCPRYYTREDNGLAKPWAPAKVWMNPPYGRGIGEWMKKAYAESQRGAFVVCLVPARTDTAWWHDYAMRGEIRFLRGRLKFGNATANAPFPSAVVIFKSQNSPAEEQKGQLNENR